MMPNSILAEYLHLTPRSAAAMQRSAAVVAGGVSRNFGWHIPYPVVNAGGAGATLHDIDGRDYIDFAYNGMSLIHGHAYAPVVDEIADALREGWAWPGSSLPQIAFAECLRARLPGVDKVRFTNSGSEATMLAVKVARRFTGKTLILKAGSAYHGTFPDLEAGLHGQHGIPGRAIVRDFGDTDGFVDAIRSHRAELAAVVIEPVLITGAVVPPPPGFLAAIIATARECDVLSVLDDCLMFRLAPGGSSEFFSIAPDIIALGKFIGGGIPTGAVCGSARIMAVFGPDIADPLYHGGSFNGNLLSSRAGLVCMRDLTADAIQRMNDQATRLRAHMDGELRRLALAATTTATGSVVGISFQGKDLKARDYYDDYTIDLEFHLACLICGLQPGAGGFFALATAIDDAILAEAETRLSRALEMVAT